MVTGPGLSTLPSRTVLGLLLDLEAVNDGRQVAEDLEGFLVELKLRSDQIRKVAEGLGGVENL